MSEKILQRERIRYPHNKKAKEDKYKEIWPSNKACQSPFISTRETP